MERLFKEFQPETVIHYAEQPSAPYSMKGYDEAALTLDNNLKATFNMIWAVMQELLLQSYGNATVSHLGNFT